MPQSAPSSPSLADSLEAAVGASASRTPASITERGAEAIGELVGLGPMLTRDLLLTAVLLVVLWGVRQIVLRLVRRQAPDDPRRLYQWRKGTTYAAFVVGLLAVVWIWTDAIGSVSTFLGLLTAGVAIALKDPLVDLAGWGFVLWRRPFTTGDRISIRGHTGDVIDQRLFQFTLLEVGTKTGAGQSTGRIVHVPNGWVFSDSVTNHTGTFAYVWHEVAVVVTFESDWRAAKQILLDVAHECADHLSEDAERTLRRAAREYFIFYSKLTPTVYTSVVGEGVQLTMRYLVAPRRVRGSEQDVWEAILDRFAARDDVDLAYPTSRIYHNYVEGKPGAGGPAREAGEAEAMDG